MVCCLASKNYTNFAFLFTKTGKQTIVKRDVIWPILHVIMLLAKFLKHGRKVDTLKFPQGMNEQVLKVSASLSNLIHFSKLKGKPQAGWHTHFTSEG